MKDRGSGTGRGLSSNEMQDLDVVCERTNVGIELLQPVL